MRESIEDANDLGHFFMIMEHKGYEIYHGNRLGFRLRGQERKEINVSMSRQCGNDLIDLCSPLCYTIWEKGSLFYAW